MTNINKTKLPAHIAIIMDGNGRWAKQEGYDRVFGHQKGVDTVREITTAAAEIGIKYLTLYTFSTENWSRPKDEIEALMNLLVATIEKETPTLNKNNVRLLMIGDIDRLPATARKKIQNCIAQTAKNTGLKLVMALSYSSRWEITNAVKKIAAQVKNGNLTENEITDKTVSCHLTTCDIPDPDLIIRTSGEYRMSNFLLWQMAYSELYFTDIHWPAFTKNDFHEAIADFQKRERRFGK